MAEDNITLEEKAGSLVGVIDTEVGSVKAWDNYCPYLYHAYVELRGEDGEILEIIPYDIGFRRLEMIDKVIYLNGKRLVITGVNRHEWSAKTGRSISMDEMTADIDCMIRNNINAVRTCHYPDQIPWYYLCDKAGIYVMAETNMESHGTFQKLGAIEPSCSVPCSIPQWREAVVDRARSNFETFKNHTAILFWSLGNESYAGDDIEAMNTYFKEKQDGRFVHYESSFYDRNYEETISDVESRMYAKPYEVEEYLNNNPKKPYLLCEYMHDMGNSMGGLGTYMKLIDDLIKAEGRIAGVKAKHFGEKLTVSSDAVVITTGGFGANVKLRQEVNTGVWKHVVLDNKIGTTNINKAAQGQGMDLAKKYGAQLIGLDDIQLHPCGTPGTGLMENIRTSGRNRIFVNVDGDRFVNEGAARDVLANAIIKQPKGTYWIVVNKVRYPARDWVDANGATIRDMVALGSVVEADSLDDLAKKTGMDAGKLKASIDGYNKIVKDGAKDPLGFVANNKADTTLTEGPWYACQKVVTVHHTMGGIKINTKAEVIGTDGKVIPGLYAAGEVTGGIHGSNRLGGNAIADVMLFGRTAGAEAAAFAKSH